MSARPLFGRVGSIIWGFFLGGWGIFGWICEPVKGLSCAEDAGSGFLPALARGTALPGETTAGRITGRVDREAPVIPVSGRSPSSIAHRLQKGFTASLGIPSACWRS